MTEEQRKLLHQMKDTAYGKVLKEYLDRQITELLSVEQCQNWEEVLGNKGAVKTLRKLLSFLDKQSPEDRGRNQYV